MFCIHCGKEIPDEAVYCVGCGRPVKPIKQIKGITPIEPWTRGTMGLLIFLSLCIAGPIGIIAGIVGLIRGNTKQGIKLIIIGAVSMGISILVTSFLK